MTWETARLWASNFTPLWLWFFSGDSKSVFSLHDARTGLITYAWPLISFMLAINVIVVIDLNFEILLSILHGLTITSD